MAARLAPSLSSDPDRDEHLVGRWRGRASAEAPAPPIVLPRFRRDTHQVAESAGELPDDHCEESFSEFNSILTFSLGHPIKSKTPTSLTH